MCIQGDKIQTIVEDVNGQHHILGWEIRLPYEGNIKQNCENRVKEKEVKTKAIRREKRNLSNHL